MLMHRYHITLPALFAALLLSFAALADESREITWDDLIPPDAEFDDVFTRLDEDTIFELSLVAQIRDRLDAGSEVDKETLENYHERVEGLEEDGVDVDGLLGMREQIVKEREAKLLLTNKELDGSQVRIPGYLLPLEFDGNKVTEFFLVPYVGACIHTPPPPPNQIVHVVTEEAFTTDGGLFTPVWVDGTIRSENKNANLSFVDGAADVPSGYAIEARAVEVYVW